MKYGVIGEHLKHTFSPEIHAAIGDYQYDVVEIEPHRLEDFFEKKDFLGVNVTIPYKEKVIPMLDFVDPAALAIGAVNTVVNREGKLYGYNTDYSGMKALISRIGLEIKGKKVLILGTGGTSKTATHVLNDLGAREIIYASRSGAKGAVTYEEVYRYHTDCEIVFNTSPVGMFPQNDTVPLELEAFERLEGVFDAVYNPIRTNFVQKAKSLGKKAEGGLYMLAAQAVHASEHFFGGSVSDSTLERVYSAVLSMKSNIVLTGMPSSGKTTLGMALAKKTNKIFVDTDEEIVKKIGMDIPEYFEKFGENSFREVESQVIKEISAQNGLVIATGGGAVLNPENARRLKHNGVVYFLDRALELLCPTENRPLSNSKADMEKRYRERYGIYLSTCDIRVENNGSIEEAIDKITRNK